MHINHSGANININTQPNCQNNFIFNHTAPINLNFYDKGKKGLDDETIKKMDPEIFRKLGELNEMDADQIKQALKDHNPEIVKQFNKMMQAKNDNL